MTTAPTEREAIQYVLGSDEFVVESRLYLDTSEEYILTTEDKLRIALADYLGAMERRREWWTPAATLLALLMSFAATDFREFLRVSADTWRAVFLIVAVLSSVWTGWALLRLRKAPTLDDVLGRFKNRGDVRKLSRGAAGSSRT